MGEESFRVGCERQLMRVLPQHPKTVFLGLLPSESLNKLLRTPILQIKLSANC